MSEDSQLPPYFMVIILAFVPGTTLLISCYFSCQGAFVRKLSYASHIQYQTSFTLY